MRSRGSAPRPGAYSPGPHDRNVLFLYVHGFPGGPVTDEIDALYETFKQLLDANTPAEAVKRLQLLSVPPHLIERIREHHAEQALKIEEMEEPRFVVRDNRDTWYTGPSEHDQCWPEMSRLLRRDGMPEPSIRSLDKASTRVVSLLNHPKERTFSNKGLVVGYVQSGKTTNFTAVMAKAADRGMRLENIRLLAKSGGRSGDWTAE